MNRRIILSVVAAAVLLPVLLLFIPEQTHVEYIPPMLPHTDKAVAIQYSDEAAFTLQERVKHSDLVIEGVVVSMASMKKQVDPADDDYWVFTIVTVKVNDIFKGDTKEETVDVQLYGGETDDVIAVFERHDVGINDDVMMFLEKSPDGIAGDNYVLVGPTSGMYLIEEDSAKHYYGEMSLTAGELRDAVKAAHGLD